MGVELAAMEAALDEIHKTVPSSLHLWRCRPGKVYALGYQEQQRSSQERFRS